MMTKFVLAACLMLSFTACNAVSHTVPQCTVDQASEYTDSVDAGHLQTSVPNIRYPYNTHMTDWGFRFYVRVNTDGRIACFQLDKYEPAELNGPRKAVLKGLADWRYQPFLKDGTPTSVWLAENIDEEEFPGIQAVLPEASQDTFHAHLERSGCLGFCPSYGVDIYGDGRVEFNGGAYVALPGKHSYNVGRDAVAGLIATMKANNIWGMREHYFANITDNPAYKITLTYGGKSRVLTDYAGRMVGMPKAVSDFENQIDAVADTAAWIGLSSSTLSRLKDENFDFTSTAAADLLATGMADSDTPDSALLDLIALGAPLSGGHGMPGFTGQSGDTVDLLPTAIQRRHEKIISVLLDKGALLKNGDLDQSRVDAAFEAAIARGDMALVQQFWQWHPGLTYPDTTGRSDDTATKTSPVTLLLDKPYDATTWDGLAIAQFLLDHGCDINASRIDGTTLLHIAAKNGDVAFVRYLLTRGADFRALNDMKETPLNVAGDENSAIALLEAGADANAKPDYGDRFVNRARSRGWKDALAWLKQHAKPPVS